MLSQLSIVAMLFTAGNCFRAGLEKEQECGESNSSPEYFTSLREKYGVEECGKKLGGGFKHVLFSPRNLGKMNPI